MIGSVVETFQLRPGATAAVTPAGDLVVEAPPRAASLGPATDLLRVLVSLLEDKPCTAEVLRAALDEQSADVATDAVSSLLDQLRAGGWLVIALSCDEAPLYEIRPVRLPIPAARSTDDTEVVLSRFVVLHRDDGQLVVESPLAWCEIRIWDPSLLGLFGTLARPTRPDALRSSPAGPVIERLLADLRLAGFVVPVADAEDTQLRLRQWSPFELWMHSRSRLDMRADFNASWGATGWAEGVFPALPSRHEPFGGAVVDLFRPDLDALRRSDPSLTGALEDRRSVREHDDAEPMTVVQLGEFLYRCARVRKMSVLDEVEHLDRPFPSGGALHELELYPVVGRVGGLEAGLYHYDAHGHRLARICGESAAVRRLIETAALATSCPSPQVVIVLSARFGRLMWKYEGMGYAAILKNVGVLYQTMYLVATAMGLAACAIGGGDAATLNDAAGLDYVTESAVGEFLLGSASGEIPQTA